MAALTAAAGATGAGVAPWAVGDLNRLANGTRDALGGGDGTQLAGNVLSNLVAGGMGALIGGPAGAMTANNADLYNRSEGNGQGEGSTKNSAIAGVQNGLLSIAEIIVNVPNGGPFASPGDRGMSRWTGCVRLMRLATNSVRTWHSGLLNWLLEVLVRELLQGRKPKHKRR